jgi:hypothetical protein
MVAARREAAAGQQGDEDGERAVKARHGGGKSTA